MTGRCAVFQVSLAPLAAGLLAIVLSGGCSAVLTVEPVGSKPGGLDPEQWDGVWCSVEAAAAHLSGLRADEGGCLTLTVIDPAEGTLKVIDGASDEPEYAAVVRREPGSEATFLTVPWPPDADGHPLWVRIRVRDDVLLFWEPRVDAFRGLVEAGVLPGSAGNDVVLYHLDAVAMRVIREHEGTLFRWDDPQILVRLGR